MNRLEDKIIKHDIISFDLFDTLLFRMLEHRHEVYDIVGKNFGIADFRKKRIEAEINATSNNNGFAGLFLKDIYEELSYIDDYEDIMQFELDTEKSLIYVNKRMTDYLVYAKSLNKKIVICSDTYFDSEFIKELLRINNIHYDYLYLSSEEGLSKSDKSMFRILKGLDVLHIGDNLSSDYLNAVGSNIDAYHYKKKKLKDKNYYYNFGYNAFGPLFAGYYRFVEQGIRESDAGTVLFVARDAYLLNNIYEKFNPGDINHYTRLSRKILSFCYSDDIEGFVDYISSNDGFTIKEFSDLYELDLQSDNLNGEIASNKNELIGLLKDNEGFNTKRHSHKEEVLRYLEGICNLDSDIVIVDTGWNGSTQYYIEKLLKELSYRHQLHGLYFGIMNSKKKFNGVYSCFGFDNIAGTGKDYEWLNSIAILETVLSAPHPGFTSISTEVNHDYTDYPELKDIHDGISAFIKDKYLDVREYVDLDYSSNYLEIIKHPGIQDVRYLGTLLQADNLGNNRMKRIISTEDFKTNLRNLDIRKLTTDTFWPVGQIKAITGVNVFDNLVHLMIRKYAGSKK